MSCSSDEFSCELTKSLVLTKMSVYAGVLLSFFDSEGKYIVCKFMDCDKFVNTCEKFEIPYNAKSLTACFSTLDYACPKCEVDSDDSFSFPDESM